MTFEERKAYDRGYKDGISDGNISNGTFSKRIKEAYENGLNDAWECAKKIVLSTEEGGIPTDTLQRLFGFGWYNTIKNISAAYAIITLKERLNKEEEPKLSTTDEIKVGDKVRTIKEIDIWDNKLFPIGTIGRVIYVDYDDYDDDKLPYKVEANNDYYWYSRDMLEVVVDEAKESDG